MPTYWPQLLASRILYDSDRSGAAGDDVDVTGWSLAAKFIVATQIGYNNKDPEACQFKLQWRDVTDSGTFEDVGATGEIKFAATSSVLTDGTEVTQANSRITDPVGMTWQQVGQENVNDNLIPDSGTIDVGSDMFTELQWALDPSDAQNGHEYEFQLYNITEGAATGTVLCTVTMVPLYYPQLLASRILYDSDRSGAANDDTDVIDWEKTDKFILATQIGYNDINTEASQFKLQWRNVTQSGSFADVGSTGQIKWSATSAVLVDETEVTSTTRRCQAASGQTWQQIGEENVADNLNPDTGTHDLNNDSYTEMQWALDPAGATDGEEYEFRLWNITEGAATGTSLCTLTIKSPPPPSYCTGYQHGVTDFSSNGGGISGNHLGDPQVVADAGEGGTGDYALQLANSTTEAYQRSCPDSTTRVCVVSFDLKVVGLSGILHSEFIHSMTTSYIGLAIGPSGSGYTIEGCVGTSYMGNHSSELSFNTWYHITAKLDKRTSTGYVDFQVDGTPASQGSLGVTSSAIDTLHIGLCDGTPSFELYINNLIISMDVNDYPIAEHKVVGLRPNADGTHDNAAEYLQNQDSNPINATYPAWNILEEVMTSTSDYVKQVTVAEDYVEVLFDDLPSAQSVFCATCVFAYTASFAGGNHGEVRVYDNDSQETVVWDSSMGDSASSLWYRKQEILTPSGGWTSAHANALKAQLGNSTDVDPVPYWQSIIIEVAYVPAAVGRAMPLLKPIKSVFNLKFREI